MATSMWRAGILFLLFGTRAFAVADTLEPFFDLLIRLTSSAVDAEGNVYIAGLTANPHLPTTPGALRTDFPRCPGAGPTCIHSFVLKISADGKVVFATYLIADERSEWVNSIAVDATHSVYVAGWVLPDATAKQPGSGFVTRISTDGKKLLATKQIVSGQPFSVAVGSSGDVFVAGSATPEGFETTPGAFQRGAQGGSDAFVMRLRPDLATTSFATLLGGVGDDAAYGLTLDESDNVYVTGRTGDMRSFPKTVGAVLEYSSAEDVFVTTLNADGSAILMSALFGPNYASAGTRIAIDDSGIYVIGVTEGPAFPLSPGAFLNTGTEFAVKLTRGGDEVVYATRIPSGYTLSAIPVVQVAAHAGKLFLLSYANRLVPTTPDSFSPCSSSGGYYVLELDAHGQREYASYVPRGLTIRGDRNIWYLDDSYSLQSFNIHDPLPAAPRCVADALSYESDEIAPGKIVSLFGPAIGPDNAVNASIDTEGKVPIYAGGVSVYFNGIAAPILYASKNQINAVVPFELAGASASTVVVLKDGVRLDGPTVVARDVAPVVVTTPDGCVAAINSDGFSNSAAHPAALGSVISVFGEGAGRTTAAVTGAIGTGTGRVVAHVSSWLRDPRVTFMGPPPFSLPVEVLYAGDVPGFVAGVFQINVKLPDFFTVERPILHMRIGDADVSGCVHVTINP
jgi:uncharacterized protein (TIGR03437 family)